MRLGTGYSKLENSAVLHGRSSQFTAILYTNKENIFFCDFSNPRSFVMFKGRVRGSVSTMDSTNGFHMLTITTRYFKVVTGESEME